jgi:signal transduction histidine kinase
MTIRRTLLIFFLLMGLTPATILTGLAFFQARDALRLEITRNLESEAATLMAQIDRILFERVQNVHTWSHLEVMQEVRVGDVDKRLSHFLFDLKSHYQGVYKNLFCSDRAGLIVAASDPALVGKPLPEQTLWFKIPLRQGTAEFNPLVLENGGENPFLEMDAVIEDRGGAGNLGTLHVQFQWSEIFRVLDRPRKNLRTETASFLALLFDGEGRVIAADAALRERGLLFSERFADWRARAKTEAVIADPERLLGLGEVLAGAAESQGYQSFAGLGWSVLAIQPTALAFAPIERMAAAFFLLLALTSAAAVGVSLLIAGGISKPIAQLTELTRRFMSGGEPVMPSKTGRGEVGDLTRTFLRMIRDLEKSRADLVRAAKLAVVGEMAAAMAHEVRTPLGIIRSSAQMLEREPGLSQTGREMLGFMLGESDRLNRLVDTLLECARPRPPVFRRNSLNAIVQRVLDLLSMQARKKNIRLRAEFESEDDELFCDEEQIVQVLLNLVMNALQMTLPDGEVAVRVQAGAEGPILLVDDSGPGLSPEHAARVFDPFFTQREGGIGLGLTVVQQIVKAHDADISTGASPAGGARFRVAFPKRPRTR